MCFRTFSDTFSSLRPDKPWVTKLSSAGLVYVHFGRQLLAQLTQLKEGDGQLEVLYDKVRNLAPLSLASERAKVDFKGRTRGENSSFSSAGFKDRNHAAAPVEKCRALVLISWPFPAKTAGSGEGGLK